MSRIHEMTISERGCRRVAAAAVVAITLAPAFPAAAFFQTTKLEGLVGSDIGGVWVSVQQIMPEFRINLPKSAVPGPPFKVGPIPAELEALTGEKGGGVVITDCSNASICSDNGIFAGDIVVKVNNADVADPGTFDAAFANPSAATFLSVRRPALKMTTARLIKIKYASEGKETPQGSEQHETVDLRVLDLQLPFDAEMEATRTSHEMFQPKAAQLDELSKKWATLPLSSPLLLLSGEHRFVAKQDFDESLSGDPSLANAKFAVLMNMEGNPVQNRGGKVIDIYGIESIEKNRIEGNYVSATLAAAPFPINIEFKGRFVMTRVADWSDADDKLRAEEEKKRKPKEDLDKFKTLPDVPAPAKKPDAAAK